MLYILTLRAITTHFVRFELFLIFHSLGLYVKQIITKSAVYPHIYKAPNYVPLLSIARNLDFYVYYIISYFIFIILLLHYNM